jgi:hypothetical protein
MITPANVVMIYGQGGMGKSTLGAQAAAFVYRTTGKKTLVINTDGGGTANAHAPLVSEGVSRIWNLDQWEEKSLFYYLEKASRGFFPRDETEPNSELVAPYKKWRECPHCGGDVGATGFALPRLCAACEKPLAAGSFCRIRATIEPWFEEVGCVIFEGMTSFGDHIMRRLKTANPEGGRSIEDKGADGSVFKISAPGMQHYGDAQSYLAQYIGNSKTIPVPLVIWTALEARGDDETQGKNLFGPKGPGKQLTGACIPWFTDVLHLDGVAQLDKNGRLVKDGNGMEILDRKLFTQSHFPQDTQLFKFAAKTSAPLSAKDMVPKVLPFPIEGNTIKTFFDALAEAKAAAGKKLLEEEW